MHKSQGFLSLHHMASFSDKQLKEYQAYLTDFDPSPQNYGDDYSAPLELDDWLDEQENEEFAGLVTAFMMNEEITSAQAEKKAHDQMDAQRDVANRFTAFVQTTTNS